MLGGMLLSKDAIADVLEVLHPGDFYKPAHQFVYDSILDLYSRGEPADPVTVSAELDRKGELKRIGGPAYLVTLTQTVPTAANAGYYAEIVSEKAILRRLVEAGTRIVQYGYAGSEGQDVARSSIGPRPRSSMSPNAAPARISLPSKSCCNPRWTRSTPSPAAAASRSAFPPGSPSSTNSPTACTPGR